MAPPRPFVVAVGGGSGSGKSTLARRLVEQHGAHRVAVLPLDAYYRDRPDLSPPARAALDFDHPDALDWPLVLEHLADLCGGRSVAVPAYDLRTHRRAGEGPTLAPAAVVVVEGLHALGHPVLRAEADLLVFVDAPEAVRLARRVARDGRERGRSAASVRAQWAATVAPAHDRHVGPTRALAHLVVRGG